MFCTKCGTKINEGERFCTGCGTKVDDIEREAVFAHEISVSEIPDISENSIETHATTNTLETTPSEHITNVEVVGDVVEPKAETTPEIIPGATVPFVEEKIKKEKVKKEKAPKAPKPKTNKIGIGFRILSAFLCCILFVVVMATALLGTVKGAFNSENIADCIEKAGVDGVSIDGDSVADIVYDNCSRKVLDELNMDREDINAIVKAIDYEDIVNKLLMPYVNYLLGFTKSPPAMGGEVVTDIMNDNKKSISDAIGDEVVVDFVYSEEVNEYIETLAQTFFDNIAFDELGDEIEEGTAAARILSAKLLYVCMIVLCVLVGVLVLLANKLHFFRAIGDAGIVMIVSAIMLSLVYLAYLAVPLAVTVPEYILSFLAPVELALVIRICAYAVVGIGCCVACKIASSVSKKKENA